MKTGIKSIFRRTIAMLLAFIISLSGVNIQGFKTKTVKAQEQYIDFGFTKSGDKEDFGAKAKVNSDKTVDFVFDFEHWGEGFKNQAKLRGINGDWNNGKDLVANKEQKFYSIKLSFDEVKSLQKDGFKIYLPELGSEGWRPKGNNVKIPQELLAKISEIQNEKIGKKENIDISKNVKKTKTDKTTKVIFHFDNYNGGKWSLWVWANGADGKQHSFDKTDDFGQTATIDLGVKTDKIGYIVKDQNSWTKNIDEDRFVDIKDETTHVWVRDEDPKTYLEKPQKISEEKPVIQLFTIDKYKELNLRLSKYVNFEDAKQHYELKLGKEDIKSKVEKIEAINEKNAKTRKIKITLKEDINLDDIISNKGKDVSIILKVKDVDKQTDEVLNAKATIGRIVSEKQFDDKYATDEELGAIYSKGETEFKLWAPTARKVELVTYNKGSLEKNYEMNRSEKGVYSYKLSGDNLGKEYMYRVYLSDAEGVEVVDPYAKSVTVNGERGVVVNPTPSEVARPVNEENMKNPIIYELHVRDFSIAENSGMKNKGKFLALTEKGTKADNGQITGLDYLKSLGVTHIQLLPIYDFSSRSVDENNIKAKYNWGYDPQNYNAVEGSYSTNPKDPFNRINELQKTVDILHENGLGVIMDVVYNHVFDTQQQSFNKIVPGYYFRMKEDGTFHSGTGVGNETASERRMMRKFMIDSTKHWVKTFKLDGLRFDLMGTHDHETMNEVYKAVKEINPNIFILGEGWNMNMGIPEDLRATQKNANKMPNLAFFNDDMRNAIKGGNDDNSTGFISGASDKEEIIINNIKGGQNLDKPYQSARQVVQYAAAHDNLTLWDKLEKSRPDDSVETRIKRQNLANAITMFSFGTPFVHAGQEFGRTKGGNHNSYNSPDSVNQFDWNRVKDFSNITDYFRELVKIRKSNEIFNEKDFEKINSLFELKYKNNGEVGYKLELGENDIYIGHNVSGKVVPFNVEKGRYKVLVMDNQANAEGLKEIDLVDKIDLSPLSTIVLQKIPAKDKPINVGTITKSNNQQNSIQNENPETGDFGVTTSAIMIVISMGIIFVIRKKKLI